MVSGLSTVNLVELGRAWYASRFTVSGGDPDQERGCYVTLTGSLYKAECALAMAQKRI